MADLRLLAVSEDGTQLLLAGNGETHRLPIDDRLRAALRGGRARLGRMETEMESQLRPRDIQARIRAGQTAEAVAEAAGMPVERVRRYEGPVLAEREHVASLAQATSVRRPGEGPSPALGDLVDAYLGHEGVDRESTVWDSWRRDDGRWTISVAWGSGTGEASAHWVYDPVRRSVVPDDDTARQLVDPPAPAPPVSLAEEPTPFVPRLAAVPNHPQPDAEPEVSIDLRNRGQASSTTQPTRARSEDTPAEPQAEPAASATGPATDTATGPDTHPATHPATDPGADEAEPMQGRRAAGERRSARRASVPSWDDIVFGSRRD